MSARALRGLGGRGRARPAAALCDICEGDTRARHASAVLPDRSLFPLPLPLLFAPSRRAAFFDPKGITGGVKFGGAALTGNWTVFPMPLDFNNSVSRLPFAPSSGPVTGPTFYRGSLNIAGAPTDTYISFCGWNKGTVSGAAAGTLARPRAAYVPRPPQ